MVGVGFGEGDGRFAILGGLEDKGGGEREAPGLFALVSLIPVDEGEVHQDGTEVGAHGLGDGVGDAEGGGEAAAGVGEDGEGERVLLDEEVVLARELRGDGDEQRAGSAVFGRAEFGIDGLPGFELGDAVGTPAAAEEVEDDGAEGEEIGRADEFGGSGVRWVERCGGGGLESEGGRGRADGEDAGFDAGGEQVVDGGVGDGEAVGLEQRAGARGDGVELGLEGIGHVDSLKD